MALPAENTLASGSLPPQAPGEEEVKSDIARDLAEQEERRRQDIQFRAEARAQREGAASSADVYELSDLPDEAGPDSSRQIAVAQHRAQRVQQQALQARAAAQNVQSAVRTARWAILVGEALLAFLAEFWPVLLVILVLFLAAGFVSYYSQPSHFAEGLQYIPRIILEPVANFLWGKAGNDQPPASTPTVQPNQQSSSTSSMVPQWAFATYA